MVVDLCLKFSSYIIPLNFQLFLLTWHNTSELFRIAIDQPILQRSPSDTLRSNQHKSFSLEWWHSCDFLVERHVRLIEIAI